MELDPPGEAFIPGRHGARADWTAGELTCARNIDPATVFKAMTTTVYYLQMFARPPHVVSPPKDGLQIVHSKRPTIAWYRFLYDAVGRDWNWASRKKLSDTALAAIIHDPKDEVHVLLVGGVPAGFVELDCRVEGEIEITQFGLMREFIGQGLGKYFLHWSIDRAWGYSPKRLWLHTCTDDHPAAIPNYLKAGFAIYREEARDKA